MSKKKIEKFVIEKLRVEFCHGQYLRFETIEGEYLGSLDWISKTQSQKLTKLREWITKAKRNYRKELG